MVYLFIHSVYVVFFKQKTAYEMRISDWSSDVCSSDLRASVESEQPTDRADPRGRHTIGVGFRDAAPIDQTTGIGARSLHRPSPSGASAIPIGAPERSRSASSDISLVLVGASLMREPKVSTPRPTRPTDRNRGANR